MTWRRLVWDNVIRLAIAVWALDWFVVGWKTFVWLDLAAFGAMVVAAEALSREGRREAERHLTLDDIRPPTHDG